MGQDPRYSSQDPYESSYASYDDRYAEPVDLDEFGSQLRSYHPNRSIVTREEFLPDDSVPLFLTDSDGSRGPKFGSARGRKSSRLVKTGILAVAASLAVFTAVAVKNPFTLFANATASLMGMGSAEVRTAEPQSPPPAPPPVQQTASTRAAPPAANQSPSRDDIAVALRTARQTVAPAEPAAPMAAVAPLAAAAAPAVSVPPAATVPPAPPTQLAAVAPTAAAPPVVAAPPSRRLAADELATLMTRAKALLASGDIPPARLLLERAAEAQEASAALMLAQTYDPSVMGTQDTRNVHTDAALARTWYQRAAQLGSADAQRRLSQLQ
jgi:cytoskeletal protein RodZ